MLIDVYCYRGRQNTILAGHAETDDPEAAIVAGRTLWDDAWTGIQGCYRLLTFYVDGQHVRTLEYRP